MQWRGPAQMLKAIKQRVKNLLETILDVEIRNRKRRIPGMISTEERLFLMKCGRLMADEPGAIVDLGTWLGASSASLAEGVKESGFPGRNNDSMIFSIDRFRWEESMQVSYLSRHAHLHYLPGESFLPQSRTYLREYNEEIELIESDLEKYEWERGPIKILHVDAMKSEGLSRQIARSFFPSLAENSILIYQDFKHWYTPWVHLIHFRLKERFKPMHEVETGGSVAFRTRETLSEDEIARATALNSISEEEVQRAFEYSFSITKKKYDPKIAAAHVMYFVHQNQRKKAMELYKKYSKVGCANDADMIKTLDFMESRFRDA